MTAAHCVVNLSLVGWDLISVRLGELDQSKKLDCEDHDGTEVCGDATKNILVEGTVSHEGYNSSDKDIHNDITLVRLSKTVAYSDYIRPICIDFDATNIKEDLAGKSTTVAGWGELLMLKFAWAIAI